MTTNEIIMLVIAGYFAAGAMLMQTPNLTSALMFKVLPLFSAVALTLIAFKII
jgi:hypothetical protein